MNYWEWGFWPFMALGMLFAFLVGILVFIFWIWMIIDAVQRKFRNSNEKIIWVLVVVLASWIGALIYFVVVRWNNPKGISKR